MPILKKLKLSQIIDLKETLDGLSASDLFEKVLLVYKAELEEVRLGIFRSASQSVKNETSIHQQTSIHRHVSNNMNMADVPCKCLCRREIALK